MCDNGNVSPNHNILGDNDLEGFRRCVFKDKACGVGFAASKISEKNVSEYISEYVSEYTSECVSE